MKQVFYWSLVAALAGFLFGFDTVVISGADQKLQTLWNTTDIFHGVVVMSMALWGTVFGAVFGGFPTKKIGRKNGRGMLRNLLGDLTGSKNNNDDFEKILENNPNFSRHLSSQLSQKKFLDW